MKLGLSSTATAAPTGANTVTLFDSTVAFGPKVLQITGIKRLSFGVKNDQAGTLIASRSVDGGTTWTVFSSQSVSAAGSNTISGPYDFLVDTFDDVKFQWTNGGVDQGTWLPELHGHEVRMPGT